LDEKPVTFEKYKGGIGLFVALWLAQPVVDGAGGPSQHKRAA
jgi:hypothetical protein